MSRIIIPVRRVIELLGTLVAGTLSRRQGRCQLGKGGAGGAGGSPAIGSLELIQRDFNDAWRRNRVATLRHSGAATKAKITRIAAPSSAPLPSSGEKPNRVSMIFIVLPAYLITTLKQGRRFTRISW